MGQGFLRMGVMIAYLKEEELMPLVRHSLGPGYKVRDEVG